MGVMAVLPVWCLSYFPPFLLPVLALKTSISVTLLTRTGNKADEYRGKREPPLGKQEKASRQEVLGSRGNPHV
ncbi:hypothetical protein E2C01_081461 [Portunus trituberculatus]|uniref:Uncharacterized protein n=1 Tax=Portunus trituberculatus TaxID=210409 RepID=A0A5B7IY91_PORTR|nr:hypothetical protein [Portunus trituberculatus]